MDVRLTITSRARYEFKILAVDLSSELNSYAIKFQGDEMKKFILAFVACVALAQSGYAATPALTESLLEYEAIINDIGSPGFDVIPVTEFIVDIKRLTKEIDILGQVKYEIITRTLSVLDNEEMTVAHSHHINDTRKRYIAILNVAQNPGVGPNIVTVLSIAPVDDHHHHHHH